MKIANLLLASAAVVIPSLALAQDRTLQPCSTEIVNHHDCKVVINRRYPVTLPTIQMQQGKKIQVQVIDPLPFETLSLDETSATGLPGTEQMASLLAAAVPDLKGLVWSNLTMPNPATEVQSLVHGAAPVDPMAKVRQDDAMLGDLLSSAQTNLTNALNDPKSKCPNGIAQGSTLKCDIVAIYAQLNQALAGIPKPGSGGGPPTFAPPQDAPNTPNPWLDYPKWRSCILYELAGSDNDNKADCSSRPKMTADASPVAGYQAVDPDFANVIGIIGTVQARLPSTPPAPPPTDPIFDQTTFDGLVKVMRADIARVTDVQEEKEAKTDLDEIQSRENHLTSVLAAVSSTLANVQKDFLTYYQNVSLADHAVPTPKLKPNGTSCSTIGYVYDPQSGSPFRYARFLGRSVVFSVDAVNNIGTAQASITPAAARVSIATLTVIYADPRLETSAGFLISFVHNRTFANATITTPAPGSGQIPGEIVIAETKTDPEIVPFVAAHVRLFDDFPVVGRRSAIYLTGTLGLNPYSTEPEFGSGFTFSWRSIMISPLYNRSHENVLLAGEKVNDVVCNPTSTAGATPPPCTPAPPAPITQIVGENAFAIAFSVRIPTSFVAGTGGVSR